MKSFSSGGMMFLTAYGALVFDAQVKKGDFVIIPAASSSVGLAAIQIANYASATPIALTRTSDKKKRLHEAGAAHVIATQEQDMVAEVMRITNGNGARVAFDPVGGPDFPKLISALTDQGIAYIYGALSEGNTLIPALEMILKMPTVKGYSIRLVTGDEARRKAAVEYVVKGLASGALKPVIDRTFEFDDMVEVHRYLENSGQFGKIVVLFYKGEQHARTLHWRMPMRLSALSIDDGTNTLGCLPLQRMPAPIRQRLRHVHAGEERQPDSDRPDEASNAYRRQRQRGYGCVLSRVRSPHLSCSEVRTGRAFPQTRHS